MTLNKLAICAVSSGLALLAVQAASAEPFVDKSDYVAPAAASQPVKFDVFLPLRDTAGLDALLAAQQDKTSARYHKWLTPEQFKARFGPTAASVARASAALRAAGFAITDTHVRSITVSGTVATVAKAFSTSLVRIQPQTGGARLAANTPLVLPAALIAEGAVVMAFSGLPPLHPDSRIAQIGRIAPDNRYSGVGPYWFDDLKQAYRYPSYLTQVNDQTLDGTGISVAVLMSGDVQNSDVKNYFESENFAVRSHKRADPTFAHVPIDGGLTYDQNSSLEASLDVEQVLGGAPGASVALIDLPSLALSEVATGYQYIVDHGTYDMVHSSFGLCETQITNSYLDTLHATFQQGNAEGVTFVASSGDSGAPACPKATLGVQWPADDPNVTAVGGGNLVTYARSGSNRSSYVRETADGDPEGGGDYWAAGGGISSHFAKPSYQGLVKTGSTQFRTVPDVGMFVGGLGFSGQECDAQSCSADDGSVVTADGTNAPASTDGAGYLSVIGTSVASPEFVGALALYEQSAGRQGNLNTFLYTAAAAQAAKTGPTVFHHPTEGFDGYYTGKQPGVDYTYIYGNGSPIVNELFGYSSAALATNPQSPSNP